MDKTESIQALINGLELSDEGKNALLKRLEQEGPSHGLMLEIQQELQKFGEQIQIDYKEQIAEINDAYGAYTTEMEEARNDFSEEIAQINAEADQVVKEADAELDTIELDSVRDTLA